MKLGEQLRWKPLWAGLLAALTLRLLIGWLVSGSSQEQGALLVAVEMIRAWWLGEELAFPGENPLFALFWTAPGYGLLVSGLSLLPGELHPVLSSLQSLAVLAAGLVVYLLVSPHSSRGLALLAALLVWFHPSMLFFEQQLSTVAVCTLLAALVALFLFRLRGQSGSRRLQWILGALLAPLPWLSGGGMALVLLVAAGVPAGTRGRVLAPVSLSWLPAMLVASLWLGAWTPMSLSVHSWIALGNNPVVAVGQGSLVDSPEAVAVFRGALKDKCSARWTRERLRCESRSARTIISATLREQPTSALRRMVFRVLQTWVPDRGLPDALAVADGRGELSGRLLRVLVALVLAPLHLGLLVGLAFAAVSARQDPRVRFLLLATLAWTMPMLVGVGATALRQACLPWIVAAGILAIARVGRRSGLERRVGWQQAVPLQPSEERGEAAELEPLS
ncbi:MAG: hypothetical protein CMP23_12190 [Rickettsiales bacterium]|nr:hypothetical protein [Rickettsiales bacterium]